MGDFLKRAVRFRNYAEELRVVAADRWSVENAEALIKIADDYERMAESLEAMSVSRTRVDFRPYPRRT